MRIKDWLIPQDKIFFQLLEEEVEKVVAAAQVFSKAIATNRFNKKTVSKIKKLEKESDQVVHEIFDHLNQTFITPLDHEDIGKIAISCDDLVDLIQASSRRVLIYQLDVSNKILKKFLVIISRMLNQVQILVKKMDKMSQKEIEKQAKTIHKLENQADNLLIKTLAKLWEKKDIKRLLQEKEVYEILETLTDKAEEFCNTIQNVVMKNL